MFCASHGTLSLISTHKFNKYHEFLSLRDVFLPQITQIIKIFFFFWFFALLKILFCLGYKTLLITKFACFRRCLKLCSTDYTDFLSLRDVLSLTDVFSHGILLPSALISPHKSNKYHEYLSLRDFFSHRLHRLVWFFSFFDSLVLGVA